MIIKKQARDADGNGAMRGTMGNGGKGSLPSDIRNSRPATSSTRTARVEDESGSSPSRNAARLNGHPIADSLRSKEDSRGSGNGLNAHGSHIRSGLVRPRAGSLPLPSRIGAGTSATVNGNGNDSIRWANPTPHGRQPRGDVYEKATVNYGTGSVDGRGGDGSVSTKASRDPAEVYSPTFSHRPYASRESAGSGVPGDSPQPKRAGGAPIYRSGSPAPVRGRKSVTAREVVDSPQSFRQQRSTSRSRRSRQQGSATPSESTGFSAQSVPLVRGGSSSGGNDRERLAVTRRGIVSSPAVRDRWRTIGGDGIARRGSAPARALPSGEAPLSSTAAIDRVSAKRPSTSEGLSGGASARGGGGVASGNPVSTGGRRGRSPSPAPRPSSGELLDSNLHLKLVIARMLMFWCQFLSNWSLYVLCTCVHMLTSFRIMRRSRDSHERFRTIVHNGNASLC